MPYPNAGDANENARTEARTFGRHLLGREIGESAVQLYVRALAAEGSAGESDALVRYAVARPWTIGALDGAYALTNPGAPLRRKLLLMAAILEAQPEYCDAFLPSNKPFWYPAVVAWTLARGAVLTGIGLLLVRSKP
jgi:hypothetical protein